LEQEARSTAKASEENRSVGFMVVKSFVRRCFILSGVSSRAWTAEELH
jgi:hypothetical protein